MDKKEIALINRRFKESRKIELQEFVDDLLLDLGDQTNSLIQLAVNRSKFTSEFRTLPDLVSVTNAALHLYCGEIDINPKRSIGREPFDTLSIDTDESITVIDPKIDNTSEVGENLKIYLTSCVEHIEYLISTGAYIYSSPLKSSKPIPEDSEEHRLFKDKFENTITDMIKGRSEDAVDHLQKLESYFVSRSELNQLTLFNTASRYTPEHHKEVRKKAYRAYLQTGFIENQKITDSSSPKLHTQKRRELLFLGWMAGKGLKKGDRVQILIGKKLKKYQRMEVWYELSEYFPGEFSKDLKAETVEAFFKAARKTGICRFAD